MWLLMPREIWTGELTSSLWIMNSLMSNFSFFSDPLQVAIAVFNCAYAPADIGLGEVTRSGISGPAAAAPPSC